LPLRPGGGFVADGILAQLVEEKLVGLGEFRAETLVNRIDQAGKLDFGATNGIALQLADRLAVSSR